MDLNKHFQFHGSNILKRLVLCFPFDFDQNILLLLKLLLHILNNLFHESLDLCFSSLKEQGLELVDLSDEERRQLAVSSVTRAAEEYGNTIMQSSSRNAYLIRRLSRITDRTMWALAEQLKKGEFKPAAFEVSFSAADNLKAMRIPISRDEALYLKGRIDRLDLCEDESHVYS